MKKKLFDRKLYVESLRQTRVIGLIAVILSCLVPTLFWLSNILEKTMRIRNNSSYAFAPAFINLAEIAFVLYLMIYLFAPLLAAKQFGFLNRRVSCDFYHAIPQTRLCLFVSGYASIITWIAVTIAASTVCAMLLTACTSFYTLHWGSVLPFMFGIFAGSVLSSSAVILGISLTGTPLMNAIVAVMILFVPRLLTMTWMELLSDNMRLIDTEHFFPILSEPLNIVVCAYRGAVISPAAGIYSLVLGLLYAALALFFFCRRRSEAAGASAPTRTMQTIFRTVFTLICCLPAIIVTCPLLLFKKENSAYRLPDIIVLYAAALIAYFLFELITTRRAKNLLRAIPGVLIVAAVNVIMIGSIVLCANLILEDTPTSEEIGSVTVELNSDYRAGIIEYYTDQENNRIYFTNPELISIVSDTLAQNVSDIRAQESKNYYETVTVGIRRGNQTTYRRLRFKETDYKRMLELMKEDSLFRSRYCSLPELGTSVSLTGYASAPYTVEQAEEIYEALRQALMTGDFSDNYATLTNDAQDRTVVTYFELVAVSGSETRYFEVPLLWCDSYETVVRMHFDACIEATRHNEEMLLSVLETGNSDLKVTVTIYSSQKEKQTAVMIGSEEAVALADYLQNGAYVGSDDCHYLVLEFYDEEGYYHSCYFRIAASLS